MLFLQFVYNQMFEECRMWHHPTTWQANEFLYDQGYDLIDIMANQRFYTANKLVEVIDIYIHKLKEGKKCKTVPFFRNMRDVFYFRFVRNTARTLKKMWEQLALQSNVLFFYFCCDMVPVNNHPRVLLRYIYVYQNVVKRHWLEFA